MEMDRKWVEVEKAGDVEFLRKRVGEYKRELEAELEANNGDVDYQHHYSSSCFLPHHHVGYKDHGNTLHLAAREGQEKMFDEIIRNLPNRLVHLLLTQHNYRRKNPLHLAAESGHEGMVKMIMGFYANLNSKSEVINLEAKPWLAPDSRNQTPFHAALREAKEECALEILTPLSENMDLEALCNMYDQNGQTPLLMAMERGLNRVALHILRLSPSYRLRDTFGRTLFHYVGKCSEEVLELLVEKHLDLINEVASGGITAVRHWINEDKLWALEYIMKSLNPAALEFKRHLTYDECSGDSIFHLFAQRRMLEASKNFAHIYREVRSNGLTSFEGEANQLPWLLPNNRGISPMEIAMIDNRTTSDEYGRLQSDLFVMESAMRGESELVFAAIKKGLYNAAAAILYVQQTYGWWCLCPPQGPQFWNAALMFSDEAAIWVVEKLPSLTSEDEYVKYVLQSASEAGAARFIEWMLKKDPSVLELAPTVWVEACKRPLFSS